MFLKRVIIKNFKSFYKTTVLDFPSKITAIVGPNGSGKSNIVDAIRWALGEQSYKSLRVETSDDLIFNSPKLAAGFAEVELNFDNSKKLFPLDFLEVSIARRIDRQGESKYFLNKEACRLKNIIEITAQTKIGVKGFSIINQGSVEDILRVSSLERKSMLEENLGLKNLEIKKEEAERKLSNSLVNLDKVKAQLEEITPHLRFLKRQVKRFGEKQQNEKELRDLQLIYFANFYKEILKEKEPQKINCGKIEEEIENLEAEILKEEKEMGLLKEAPDKDLEVRIKEITNNLLDKQNEKFKILEKIKTEERNPKISLSIYKAEEKISFLEKKLEELLLVEDIAEIKKGIKEILKEIEVIPQKNELLETKNEEFKNQLDLLEKEIEKARETLSRLQEELNQQTQKFREKFQFLEQKRQKKEKLLIALKEEELKTEKYKLKFDDFIRRLEEEEIALREVEEYLEEAKEEVIDSAALERKIWRLKREISEVGAVDENVMKEYEETETRYNFLSSQINDLTKAIEDLKNLTRKLTKQIEEEFFAGINAINKDFSRYFRLMFKGGSAKLVVKKNQKQATKEINSENETLNQVEEKETVEGVEIVVDIPKTKIKNVEILSGGEKTLTAISLLFAIVNQSDPPLVIVDEIDAALDEENSRRFAEILQELSKDTQFIIVTHNRLSMSAAQIIYGVTLKNNVSQLLSIKLEDSEKILAE